jgi:hypothetical protein
MGIGTVLAASSPALTEMRDIPACDDGEPEIPARKPLMTDSNSAS